MNGRALTRVLVPLYTPSPSQWQLHTVSLAPVVSRIIHVFVDDGLSCCQIARCKGMPPRGVQGGVLGGLAWGCCAPAQRQLSHSFDVSMFSISLLGVSVKLPQPNIISDDC